MAAMAIPEPMTTKHNLSKVYGKENFCGKSYQIVASVSAGATPKIKPGIRPLTVALRIRKKRKLYLEVWV